MNLNNDRAYEKNERCRISDYYEAIAYVKEKEDEARALRESCEAEIALFEETLENAFVLAKRARAAKYIGSENSIEEKKEEFIQRVNASTPSQICGMIRKYVEILESLIAEQGRYHSNKSDETLEKNKLKYYSTYLCLIVAYFYSEKGSEKQKTLYIAQMRSDCREKLRELYKETYENVKSFCSRVAREDKRRIKAVEERVEMPHIFPNEARIDIGYYEEQTDDGIEYASKLLGGDTNELEYKRLILEIADANRSDRVLSLDISSPNESNNIIIHQPKYSLREIDHNGRGNDDRVMIELLESMVCRYMSVLPRISKRICVIQNRELSELEAFENNLYRTANELVFTDVSKEGSIGFSSIDEALKELLGECRAAKELLMPPCRNVYEFNKSGYSDGVWKQMTLLIIKDYPLGFDSRSVKYLNYILQDANKYGIHVVMTVCDDLLNAAREQLRDTDFESVFKYFDPLKSFRLDGQGLISSSTYEFVDFSDTTISYDSFNMRKYLSHLENRISNSTDPAIPLRSLIDKRGYESDTERRKNFFKVLDFPIGRIGTSDCSMKLYQSGGGSPHVVIAGTTGSGKSVLLQDIILSAACHYSPDELEMYLFDFKETPKGFERYGTGFPHVRKIATQCKERDIFELLSMIKSIYTKRMKKAGAMGFTDINSYNAYAKDNGLERFPRIMVLIDEYQTIQSDKCLSLLLEIAQKGREFGVALIMASQNNSPQQGFAKILKLFGHRIEFKNEPLGGLINRISTRAQDLNGPKGLCFYSNDGSAGLPVLLRCAYVNDEDNEEIKAFSQCISKKFGSGRGYKTYRVGDVERIERPIDLIGGSFAMLGELERRDPSIKLFNDEISSEEEWSISAKEKYKSSDDLRERGFILRLGLNSLSLAGTNIKLDRSNPYLFLSGDFKKCKSLEYSVIRSAVLAAEASNSDKKPLIYYIEGDRKFDRALPVYDAMQQLSAVRFVRPDAQSIYGALCEINEEYISRKKASGYNEYEPMLVMLSSFDSLMSVIEEQGAAAPPALSKRSSAIRDKYAARNEDDAVGAKAPSEREKAAAAEKNEIKELSEKLKTLLNSDLYNYGIFFVMQMNDTSCTAYLKSKINTSKSRSLIYLPKNNALEIEHGDIMQQLKEYFSALLGYRSDEMEKLDISFSYGCNFVDKGIQEFIPYEFI